MLIGSIGMKRQRSVVHTRSANRADRVREMTESIVALMRPMASLVRKVCEEASLTAATPQISSLKFPQLSPVYLKKYDSERSRFYSSDYIATYLHYMCNGKCYFRTPRSVFARHENSVFTQNNAFHG